MALEKKTTRLQETIDLLISQYRDKPNIVSLLSAFGEQVQLLENAIFDTLEGRQLATAVGAQLDGIGRIVGQARNGQSDAVYRDFLQAKILVNNANGTPEELIEIASVVSGSSFTFEYVENFPADFAHFDLQTFDPYVDVDTATVVANFVFTAKPAGVRGIFKFGITEPFFVYDGTAGVDGYDDGFYIGAIAS